jgi:hypothetical protein
MSAIKLGLAALVAGWCPRRDPGSSGTGHRQSIQGLRSLARPTLLSGVHAPGGQARRGRWLYFNAGNTLPVLTTGTIDRLKLPPARRPIDLDPAAWIPG